MAETSLAKPMVVNPGALSLRKNFSWTAVGNVFYAACQWGIISMLAKLGGMDMVGIFALGLAITTPITQFFQLQLRGVQATDATRSFDFPEYFTLRTLTTIAALVVSTIAILFSRVDTSVLVAIELIAISKAIDAMSDVFYGSFQQREQMDLIAKAMIVNGVLSLALMSIGIWATGELIIGVLGYLAGSLAPLLFYTIPVQRRYLRGVDERIRWFRRQPDRIRSLARLAFPLGVVMLFVSLNSNVPQYLIEHRLGTADLGVFAALSYLVLAGTTVVGALGQAVSPRLAGMHAAKDYHRFRVMILKLMGFGLLLGLAGFALATTAGGWILAIIYTSQYSAYNRVLMILTLAAGVSFAASFAGYGMTAARKFKVQVLIFGVVLIVSAVSSLVLIPRYGLEGAGWALASAALAHLVASSIVVYRATRAIPEVDT